MLLPSLSMRLACSAEILGKVVPLKAQLFFWSQMRPSSARSLRTSFETSLISTVRAGAGAGGSAIRGRGRGSLGRMAGKPDCRSFWGGLTEGGVGRLLGELAELPVLGGLGRLLELPYESESPLTVGGAGRL